MSFAYKNYISNRVIDCILILYLITGYTRFFSGMKIRPLSIKGIVYLIPYNGYKQTTFILVRRHLSVDIDARWT